MEVIIDGIVYVPKENKSEIDILKEKYESGDYIGVCKSVDNKWVLSNVFVNGFSPKLIHKKHKKELEIALQNKH